jgi:hypothetical protein
VPAADVKPQPQDDPDPGEPPFGADQAAVAAVSVVEGAHDRISSDAANIRQTNG